MVITSAYRCFELNTHPKLGGSTRSQHCYGQAIDIQVPGVNTAEIYNFIYGEIDGWDQLIWEYPEKGNSWVHVSVQNQLNRRKTTLASNSDAFHNIYGGTRRGSGNQYQDGITTAQIV